MTTTSPHRITTLQYVKASLAVRLGLEPEHEGANEGWADLLRDGLSDRSLARPDDTAPVRRPFAALAATPYREVVDLHLGTLRIATLEPARLYNTLAGGTR